jgi:biopolymer transport protein ExbD
MRRRRFDQINVVPFIDIVLVLLVIVLATATFAVKNELNVDLPESGSRNRAEAKHIVITIKSGGEFFYNGRHVSPEELERELEKLDPLKDPVTLNADRKSEFQKFVSVVDMLKSKKFKKISITTRQ